MHVLTAQSAARPSTTAESTRERSFSPATALRPAARPPTAPSAPPLENACGLDSLSAQVNLKGLNSISILCFSFLCSILDGVGG